MRKTAINIQDGMIKLMVVNYATKQRADKNIEIGRVEATNPLTALNDNFQAIEDALSELIKETDKLKL